MRTCVKAHPLYNRIKNYNTCVYVLKLQVSKLRRAINPSMKKQDRSRDATIGGCSSDFSHIFRDS